MSLDGGVAGAGTGGVRWALLFGFGTDFRGGGGGVVQEEDDGKQRTDETQGHARH